MRFSNCAIFTIIPYCFLQETRNRRQAIGNDDLEIVNIVLNSSASGNDDDDSSLDSDDTLESDTDSLDEEFNTHNHYDTDSVSG